MSTRAVTPAVAAPVAVLTPQQRPMLQRTCDCGQHTGGECEECKKKKKKMPLQRDANGSAPLTLAPPIVHQVLSSPGQPLDPGTQSFMESRFQHDFSHVRVHTDERSAESARSVSAHAYTVGRHVVFGAGCYAPETTSGRALLSHELTHVVQQADAPYAGCGLRIGEPQDAAEHEAAQVEKTEAGRSLRVDHSSQPLVQGSWDWGGAGWGTLIGGGIGAVAGGLALAAGASPLAALAILGGGLLAGFVIGGLVGGDPTKIDNPPVCGDRQLAIIAPAMKQAANWVSQALARFTAYKTAPTDPANKVVHDQLMTRFHSDASDTVGKIERVLSTMKGRFSSGDLKPECHAAQGICAPPFAAYVQDAHTVVFCPSFFEGSQSALTIVHEMSHALVGGPQISDRGYQGERIFTRLSTDEALTNAESYAEFVVDIATGKPVAAAATEDNVDGCPKDWQEPVKAAVAKAERWTTNAINIFAEKANATYWATLAAKHLPAPPAVKGKAAASTPDKDLQRALGIYRAANTDFANPIHFVCQPTGGSPCDKGGSVAWLSSNSKFFICADWKAKNADDQVVSMLAGLYGYLTGLNDPAWRTGLARIAYEVTQKAFKVPSHSGIVGSAAWSTNQITIDFRPTVPGSAAKPLYEESGTKHERLSMDVPSYAGPECQKSALPFTFNASFSVDAMNQERPGPYKAPKVAMEYSLEAPGSTVHGAQTDPETTPPREPGSNLATKLDLPVNVQLNQNGPFHIKITLEDPESGVTRVYEDVIQVLAVRPCDLPDKGPKQTPPGSDPSKHSPGKQKRESALA